MLEKPRRQKKLVMSGLSIYIYIGEEPGAKTFTGQRKNRVLSSIKILASDSL